MTHQRQRQDSRIPPDSNGPRNVLDRNGAPAVDRVILQELRDLARRKNAARALGSGEALCALRTLGSGEALYALCTLGSGEALYALCTLGSGEALYALGSGEALCTLGSGESLYALCTLGPAWALRSGRAGGSQHADLTHSSGSDNGVFDDGVEDSQASHL